LDPDYAVDFTKNIPSPTCLWEVIEGKKNFMGAATVGRPYITSAPMGKRITLKGGKTYKR
jgi:hypothetical protein